MFLKLMLLFTALLMFACSESQPEDNPELDASGSNPPFSQGNSTFYNGLVFPDGPVGSDKDTQNTADGSPPQEDATVGEGGEESGEGNEGSTTEEGGEGEEGPEEGGEEGAEEGGEIINYPNPPEFCGPDNHVECIEPLVSSQGVLVSQVPSGKAPKLNGGDPPEGDYLIDSIVLYPGSMMADGAEIPIEFTLTNNGSTGAVRFNGEVWSLATALNVELSTEFGVTSYEGEIQGGGCFLIAEGAIISDITQCYSGGEETLANFPTAFPYEYQGDTLQILLAYPITDILSSLEAEPDVFAIASAFLVNDLEGILVLTKQSFQ